MNDGNTLSYNSSTTTDRRIYKVDRMDMGCDILSNQVILVPTLLSNIGQWDKNNRGEIMEMRMWELVSDGMSMGAIMQCSG